MNRTASGARGNSLSNISESTAVKQSIVFLRNLPQLHCGLSTSLRALALRPEPQTALYLTACGKSVVEVVRFSTPHSSWLLRPRDRSKPDVLEQCGDAVFVSAVDPLFAALPMLASRRDPGGGCKSSQQAAMFQPVDSLLIDENNVCCTGICDLQQLRNLCDVKTVQDECFIRLNDEKVLRWLQAKLTSCTSFRGITEKDALSAVCGYLSEDWSERFRESVAPACGHRNETLLPVIGDKTGSVHADDPTHLAYAEFARSARANASFMATETATSRRGTSQSKDRKRKTSSRPKPGDVDTKGLRLLSSFFAAK